MKTLLVAEKESAAMDFVKALEQHGSFNKVGRSYESDKYIVTWLQGHVISMKQTKDYPNWEGEWALSALPWYPPNMDFEYKVTEKTERVFNAVKGILLRKDIELIVAATDAGREGDLIFWELYDYLRLNVPVKRFYESAVLTVENVNRIMKNDLKGKSFYAPMKKAAYARAYADLLLGMNFTIGFTAKAGLLLNLGRVKTPTLAILANRRKEIDNFIKQKYYEVSIDFGEYKGVWFKEQLGNTKINDESEVEGIKNKVTEKLGKIVKKEVQKAPEKHPMLYSLTTLQREASRKFDLTPNETLEIAQSLYDNHKVLSYPRSDSEVIGTAHIEQLRPILDTLVNIESYGEFAQYALNAGVPTNSKFVNDKALTDHHALIPTNVTPNLSSMNANEKKIYDLVVRRFLSVFYPDAIYEKTAIITEVEGETFKTNGRIEIQKGWKAVYGNSTENEDHDSDKKNKDKETVLPPLNDGEERLVKDVEATEKFTSPPKLHTYDTLLGVMENPRKMLNTDDGNERYDLLEKFEAGLGTPATRANILEELVNGGYVVKSKKNLDVTSLGAKLIEICPQELKSPIITAEWESKLYYMGKGEEDFDEFMRGIQNLIEQNIKELTDNALTVDFSNERGSKTANEKEICSCRICGQSVRQRGKAYICDTTTKENICFLMGLEVAKKKVTEKLIKQLMDTGITEKIEGFVSKEGKKFPAKLWINNENKVAFNFEADKIGSCFKCGKDVIDAGTFYKCESYNKDNKCFAVSKEIAKKKITPTIVKTILLKKETPIYKDFVSNSGKKFEAKLKYEEGKITFAFAEKPRAQNIAHDSLICPSCNGGHVKESDKGFSCSNWQGGCKFSVWKNGKVTIEHIEKMISEGETGVIKGLKGQKGTYDANFKWNAKDKKVETEYIK